MASTRFYVANFSKEPGDCQASRKGACLMEDFKSPVPVEWNNQLVLVSVQLAKFYGCAVEHIHDNFRKNKDRFVMGKHYFKLEGEVLKQFKADYFDNKAHYFDEIELVSPRAPHLYLWTERGCARHAKMLSTDKAWEVFEMLEDTYFNQGVKTAPVIETLAEKVRRPLSPTACVYALLMSNGTVKIGHTGNIRERVAKIKRQTGLTVNKLHFTFDISRDIARKIEWACQENFSLQRMKGEFFNCTFAEICGLIDSFVKVELERNDNLLKIADKMESSSERHLILIRAANFFVGQCSA